MGVGAGLASICTAAIVRLRGIGVLLSSRMAVALFGLAKKQVPRC